MANINKAQQEALNTLDGPVLIIAGPGSGKTFTLVERIVKLIQVKGDHQYEDSIVLAKAKATKEYASHSQIEYKMIKGTDANAHIYQQLLGRKVLSNNVSLI